jgi:hypothetical protein
LEDLLAGIEPWKLVVGTAVAVHLLHLLCHAVQSFSSKCMSEAGSIKISVPKLTKPGANSTISVFTTTTPALYLLVCRPERFFPKQNKRSMYVPSLLQCWRCSC